MRRSAALLILLFSACRSSTPVPLNVPKSAYKPRARATPVTKTATTAPSVREDPIEHAEAEVRPEKPRTVLCEGEPARRLRKGRLIWPVDGVVISAFGQRDGSPHEGIDIGAPVGTPIWSSREGDVLYSGEQPGYGLMVIVRHPDDMVTIYAHNAKNCVREGAHVEQGEVIAVVGDSGDASSPSVHFEVRVKNKTVNPRAHLTD